MPTRRWRSGRPPPLAREDARRAQANVAATREAASKARRDAPLVERLLREAARLEDDLARRRRQRRASAEFKELSKAEADGRNHASQCRAAAETYERAARRLQLVPSTAKNAEGTNLQAGYWRSGRRRPWKRRRRSLRL